MTEPTLFTQELLERLRGWEGRSEAAHDLISVSSAQGMAATLGLAGPGPDAGAELPPLWHWLFFAPRAPRQELGADGHPRVGGFLPPVPLPRRMWAGGRIRWHAPLRIGEAAKNVTTIESVKHKGGRSGDLLFVTLKYEISTVAGLALTEEKDVVYREAASAGAVPPVPPEAPQDAAWSEEIVPDPVLLFRYSALTFNGHRIHYDRPYTTQIEAYPGLVVHGPLIATLLAGLAQRARPGARFTSFSFRAVSPLVDIHPFRVCGKPSPDGKSAQLWAENHEGRLAMQADVQYE
ncbi:MAG: MaoC family dehydratase N-terminal domain-containing protein [Pseudomonadota bacterium]